VSNSITETPRNWDPMACDICGDEIESETLLDWFTAIGILALVLCWIGMLVFIGGSLLARVVTSL
jgi:hypothetical protein